MSAFLKAALLLVSLGAALCACPPSNGNPDGGGADGGACDSFPTEHERLLNAPTSAAVVKKTPSIPEGAYP